MSAAAATRSATDSNSSDMEAHRGSLRRCGAARGGAASKKLLRQRRRCTDDGARVGSERHFHFPCQPLDSAPLQGGVFASLFASSWRSLA
jgi:hypothetical protein